MIELPIKPISVNSAYTGRRFSTEKHKAFKTELEWMLPKNLKIPPGKIWVKFVFGFSSHLSDIDGAVKQSLDVISEFYGFNDRIVYRLHVDKEITAKGKEFIRFAIMALE